MDDTLNFQKLYDDLCSFVNRLSDEYVMQTKERILYYIMTHLAHEGYRELDQIEKLVRQSMTTPSNESLFNGDNINNNADVNVDANVDANANANVDANVDDNANANANVDANIDDNTNANVDANVDDEDDADDDDDTDDEDDADKIPVALALNQATTCLYLVLRTASWLSSTLEYNDRSAAAQISAAIALDPEYFRNPFERLEQQLAHDRKGCLARAVAVGGEHLANTPGVSISTHTLASRFARIARQYTK